MEGLLLKPKLQHFGHLMWRANSLEKKDLEVGKACGQEEKGAAENARVRWHQWLNGHEFEQALGDGGGQRSLLCCSPWGCKQSHITKPLSNSSNKNVGREKPACSSIPLSRGWADTENTDQSLVSLLFHSKEVIGMGGCYCFFHAFLLSNTILLITPQFISTVFF